MLLIMRPMVSYCQSKLIIEITDLRSNNGKLLLQLYDENEEKLEGATENIYNNKCIIIFENLKPGKYAFRYFHDENNNDDLDSNFIGIPNEGYGFSNNARVFFGSPSFKKQLFEVKKTKKMICKPKY